MDLYLKYKKYKYKYHQILGSSNIKNQHKENINLIVENNILDLSDSQYQRLFDYLKINPLSDDILLDIVDFNKGCEKIAKWLNSHLTESQDKPIPVICPGDSPSKIIIFLEKSDLIDNKYFNFISFSLSGMVDYYEHYDILQDSGNIEIQKYIANQIKTYPNLENLLVMDYIARGSSIYSIIDAIKYLLPIIKHSNEEKCNEIIRKIVQIDNELISLLKYRYDNMFNSTKSPKPKTNDVINIANYFETNISYIMEAEKYNSRCLPSNDDYVEKEYSKDEQFNCNFFVYLALLYNSNSEKFIILYEQHKLNQKYTRQNIKNFFNKIIGIKIVNEKGLEEEYTGVFLSDLGYGGKNTIKMVICPTNPEIKAKYVSLDIGRILNIQIERDLGNFQSQNNYTILNITYLDKNLERKSDYVFYDGYNFDDKFKFIKMNLLESDFPIHKYDDPINHINIYPNQLLTVEYNMDLPTKKINIDKGRIIRVHMINGIQFTGFLSSNYGYSLLLRVGSQNKEIMLINNLIEKIESVPNDEIDICKYKSENLSQILRESKFCKFIFTNGNIHEYFGYYKYLYNESLTLQDNLEKDSPNIIINICQLLDIQMDWS